MPEGGVSRPAAGGAGSKKGPQRALSASRRRYHEVGHRGPRQTRKFFFQASRYVILEQ